MTPNQAILTLARVLLAEAWADWGEKREHYYVRGLPEETWRRVEEMADELSHSPDLDELEAARETLADYAEPAEDLVLVRRLALREMLAHLDAQEQTTGTAPCRAPFTTVVRRALEG